jgi:hypothetical protein
MFFRNRSQKFRLIVLGLALAAVGVGLWSVWRHPDNTLPLEDVVDRSLLTAPGEVNLVVLNRRTVMHDDGKHHYLITLALANDGDRAVEYYGYPPVDESRKLENGYIQPGCDLEIPQGAGWTQQGWRCGTGLEPLILRPGQAGYIEQYQVGDKPIFRMTLRYHDAGDKREVTRRIVASEPIDARGSEVVRASEVKRIHHQTMSGAILSAIRRVFR